MDYYERYLEIAKELEDKADAAKSFYPLGRSFELQGSPPSAIYCDHSSVKMFHIVRHDLKGKSKVKIIYHNMYERLWRVLLNQGKVNEALFAAEQGRAQALNDLLELNYGFETAYYPLHTRQESTYDPFSFLALSGVFIAIDERDIVLWVVQDGKDVELRRKELCDNSSSNWSMVMNLFLSPNVHNCVWPRTLLSWILILGIYVMFVESEWFPSSPV